MKVRDWKVQLLKSIIAQNSYMFTWKLTKNQCWSFAIRSSKCFTLILPLANSIHSNFRQLNLQWTKNWGGSIRTIVSCQRNQTELLGCQKMDYSQWKVCGKVELEQWSVVELTDSCHWCLKHSTQRWGSCVLHASGPGGEIAVSTRSLI